ncbi:sialate O-acetylesterase [Verrucomicrobia bacterium]|nr:sialate O-acetylesterase [Verrucomicrobiota bacterium]
MKIPSLLTLVSIILISFSHIGLADVKLPNVIGSGMVLQRDMAVPVWGWAEVGEEVTVSFAGQTKKTKTGDDGKWTVSLDPLKANGNGSALTITGKNKITLENVLVGEVWICSGQSNMEWAIKQSMNPKEEAAAANYPQIRLFNVPGHTVSPLPKDEGAGQWQVCDPNSANNFSAVGYFFGRRLHKDLKVPVGLIGSNWGGTRIEPWTTLAGFESVPELSKIADQVKNYKQDTRVGGGQPSAIYNSMVHPLTPFAMRGGIWYQGESNGNEGITYYQKKHALVNGWRKAFQNKDLAFYWVQLANFQKENDKPEGGDGWAKLREAQTQALDIPGTGMAVITDIGAANDIHPRNKQDVGWRLAQWALHQTYGQKDLVPSGPLYKSHKVEGKTIRLSFDHVGSGLIVGKKNGLEPTAEVKDGKLEHFSISGKDNKWVWADARIDGQTVIVESKEVTEPVAVRYGFTMNPAKANLYNKEGLPAGPFRTDTE